MPWLGYQASNLEAPGPEPGGSAPAAPRRDSRAGLAQAEPHAGIEPAFPAWKAGTLTVVLVRQRRSGWNRTSGLPGFNRTLCQLSYRPLRRDAATRTPSSWAQAR